MSAEAESTFNAIFLIVFIVVFPIFWCFVLNKISHKGWSDLASVFATNHRPRGEWFVLRSGRFKHDASASYHGVLFVVLAPEGIFMSVMLLFRYGHRNILAPWTNVFSLAEKGFWLFKYTEVQIGAAERVFLLRLPKRALSIAKRYKELT